MSTNTESAHAQPATIRAVSSGRARVEPVDILRGAVMILMTLDHVRDFFGMPGANPTNLATTTVPLFFTRWVTHFCAPVFFLLTGTGAYLSLRHKNKRQLSRFLFTRGLWLIFLELGPLRWFGFQFNFDYHVTMLFILWALGWAMIVLSALVYLPDSVIVTLGLIIIATHNLLDAIQSSHPLWTILHAPNVLLATPQHVVFVAYPLIPWIGVTAVGYGLGKIYGWEPGRRRMFLGRLGISLITLFVVLRGINIYGDPLRWAAQKSPAFSVLSFLNTTKYPPSLLFLLMTLGPAMLCLMLLDRRPPPFLQPVLTIGKVPLFYYVLHIPLIHLLALAACFARYGHVHWVFESPTLGQFPFTTPPGWGFSLPATYLLWAVVVLTLYPLCRWYAGVKRRRDYFWLSYL